MGPKTHREQTGELRKSGVVLPEFPAGHSDKKPHSALTRPSIYYSASSILLCVNHPATQKEARDEAPCCLLLTWGSASSKPFPSSVRPSSSTESINPFSFPFLSSVDSLRCSFGLLITARREADGSDFRDTITAKSSSLHCLEACLYLSPNPFCHF